MRASITASRPTSTAAASSSRPPASAPSSMCFPKPPRRLANSCSATASAPTSIRRLNSNRICCHFPVAKIRRLIPPIGVSSAIGTFRAARLLKSKRYNTISASYDVTHALLAFDPQKLLAEPAQNRSHHRQHRDFHVPPGRHGGHVPRVLSQRPHAGTGPAAGGAQPHLLHRVDAAFLRSGDSTRAGGARGDGLAMVQRRL